MTLQSDVATGLDSLLTVWSASIGADGLWNGCADLPNYWSCAASPAAACAIYDSVVPEYKWAKKAIATIEGALANYNLSGNGSFGPTGNPDNSIDTMEFGKVLTVCLSVYGSYISPARKARWIAAMLGGCEYLNTRGNLRYYTNGNINIGNYAFLKMAHTLSGDRKMGHYADKAWWTLHDPKASIWPDWEGWGYVETVADTAPYNGAAAKGYFTEEGPGGNGLDWGYSIYSLDELSLLYLLTKEPRVGRLINTLLNTLLPRVNTATWICDATGGTRQGVGLSYVPRAFTTPGLAVATRLLGRTGLPDYASQYYNGECGIYQTYAVGAKTNNAPGFYRGSYTAFAAYLLAVSQ